VLQRYDGTGVALGYRYGVNGCMHANLSLKERISPNTCT
jgi:hypothetical protein